MKWKVAMEPRGSGKTTRLFERAVSLVAELPEGHNVYVTGPHTVYLLLLRRDFRSQGLDGVAVLTITEILNHALRGRRGVLLIDDIEDISYSDLDLILIEASFLESNNGYILTESGIKWT